MRIEITQDFNDLEAADDDHRRVVAGTKMTVTAARGEQLIGLRIATEVDALPKKPTTSKRAKPSADTAPPMPAPAPATAPAQTAAQTETETPAT